MANLDTVLVYNLEPSPGYAASLAFDYLGDVSRLKRAGA